jgi:hypothetical protein
MTIKELLKQRHFKYIEELEEKLNPIKFTNTRFDKKMFAYVSKSKIFDIEAITEQNEDGDIESWTR